MDKMRSLIQKHTNHECMQTLINRDAYTDCSGICEWVIFLQTTRRGRSCNLCDRWILWKHRGMVVQTLQPQNHHRPIDFFHFHVLIRY